METLRTRTATKAVGTMATVETIPRMIRLPRGPPVLQPSLLDCAGMRFLIFEEPTATTLEYYLQMLDKVAGDKHCTWVRASVEPPSYDEDAIVAHGFDVMTSCAFAEGGAPPHHVLRTWLDVCGVSSPRKPGNPARVVAVHDVSGLGRAPLLVALALVEAGVPAESALTEIRNVRRGALGKHQQAIVLEHVPIRAAWRRSWLGMVLARG